MRHTLKIYLILKQMRELAKMMPEYNTVISMGGIGESLAPRLIAEIGDPRYFHSAKALIAYAGIDAPPYQSCSSNSPDAICSCTSTIFSAYERDEINFST